MLTKEIIKKILAITALIAMFIFFLIFVWPSWKKTINKVTDSAFISAESKKSSVSEPIEEVGADLNWYSEESITHVCKQVDGPGKMIKDMDLIGAPHEEVGEKKIGDTVVQVTIKMPAQRIAITYYRGKERCEAALNKVKDAKKAVADKFN